MCAGWMVSADGVHFVEHADNPLARFNQSTPHTQAMAEGHVWVRPRATGGGNKKCFFGSIGRRLKEFSLCQKLNPHCQEFFLSQWPVPG